MIGQRISHYQIFEKLGGGGMGVVYKAKDLKLDRFVALKFLPPHLSADEDEKKRFIHEAKAASALDHPNICTIHEIGETEDGQLFIVMAYYDGETLKQRISRGQLAVAEAVEIIKQVGQGLAKAHEHGIIHRDIKSANVMLTKDVIVKILDFGLAKLAGGTQLTKTGMAMGTVAYMSPEQVQRLPVDHRTDIWSLGVVLYEMLTGKLPFEGEHEQPIMFGIVSDEPPSVRSLKPEVSVGLEQIVNRAMAKEPAERYQNISELLIDLKQSKSGEYSPSVKSKRKTVAPAGRNLKKRSPLKWPLAVLALATFGAVLLYLTSPLLKRTTQPSDEILLTSLPGPEWLPAFSPDGNMIAFTWNGDDKLPNPDIYVKLIGAESQVRLTTYPGFDLYPAWSPDGRSLAFGRRYVGGNGKGAVMIIPALGGPERKLYEVNWGDYGAYSGLDWSPDGKWLAFAEADSSQRAFCIFLLSYETLEKRRLTFPPTAYYGDYLCKFSPDGKRLAIIRAESATNADIHLVAIAGGEPERLTYFNQRIPDLAWMPDGQEIVFSSSPDDELRLWRISASGGEPQPLGVKGTSLTIPRKKHRLAYSSWRSDSDLWRIDLTDTKKQKSAPIRLAPSSRNEAMPQISPDGRTVVFASSRTGKTELWKCDSDGRNPIQLTSLGGMKAGGPIWSPASGGYPSWSPDSRYIAFDNRLEDQSDIFIISAAGSVPQRFTTEASDDVMPSWSRDGRSIYFTSKRSGEYQIWKQPVAEGNATQVTKQGGYGAFESFDDKWVYYSKIASLSNIWRTPVDGGDESLVLEVAMRRDQWALAEDGVYYGARTGSQHTIDFFSFVTGKSRTAAVVPGSYWIQSLAVSPDQRWLVYSYTGFEVDIIMVENFR